MMCVVGSVGLLRPIKQSSPVFAAVLSVVSSSTDIADVLSSRVFRLACSFGRPLWSWLVSSVTRVLGVVLGNHRRRRIFSFLLVDHVVCVCITRDAVGVGYCGVCAT
jgi:hypothetical protein